MIILNCYFILLQLFIGIKIYRNTYVEEGCPQTLNRHMEFEFKSPGQTPFRLMWTPFLSLFACIENSFKSQN